jgi:hypothetical protein
MSKYELWNDTSVAYIFIRLITKKNIPINENILTFEEFKNEYNILKGYIKWHKNNYKESSPLYNFTQKNLLTIFKKINYKIDNETELLDLWKKIMLRKKDSKKHK